MSNLFKNKVILITGGTGSFGSNFLKKLIFTHKNFKKIIIFSRDELKQFELQNSIKSPLIKKCRFFIGDVRDKSRLIRALDGVDIVIHAAALKQVPAAEYDPFEFIKTNVIGAQNLIEASLDSNVKKVIALSTDKSAGAINLYGASKLCSDKLFSSANNIVGKKKIKFSVVRYGNVFGSRGSIVPLFTSQQKKKEFITVTDKRMTRFNISLEDGIKMVEWSLNNMKGGEIFVPKIPSFRVMDLAKVFVSEKKIKVIGIRPGEKLHEEMITTSDSFSTYDLGKYYVIINPSNKNIIKYYSNFKKFAQLKSYSSDQNNNFLTTLELSRLVENFKKTKLKNFNY
jgi:UDP-N-acetylglucosamine 4,6-dehydratase (inverting)